MIHPHRLATTCLTGFVAALLGLHAASAETWRTCGDPAVTQTLRASAVQPIKFIEGKSVEFNALKAGLGANHMHETGVKDGWRYCAATLTYTPDNAETLIYVASYSVGPGENAADVTRLSNVQKASSVPLCDSEVSQRLVRKLSVTHVSGLARAAIGDEVLRAGAAIRDIAQTGRDNAVPARTCAAVLNIAAHGATVLADEAITYRVRWDMDDGGSYYVTLDAAG